MSNKNPNFALCEAIAKTIMSLSILCISVPCLTLFTAQQESKVHQIAVVALCHKLFWNFTLTSLYLLPPTNEQENTSCHGYFAILNHSFENQLLLAELNDMLSILQLQYLYNISISQNKNDTQYWCIESLTNFDLSIFCKLDFCRQQAINQTDNILTCKVRHRE